jgi:hypothetical protein
VSSSLNSGLPNPAGLAHAGTLLKSGLLPAQLSWHRGKGLPMSANGKDEALLQVIADMMEGGLETQTEPFPETEKEFGQILTELRALNPEDLQAKLVISGFVNHPYGPEQQRCLECMYYLVHRQWCDLPELSVPVEPQWWCRLWRI